MASEVSQPPDHIKVEIEHLLERAMATDDLAEMENLFHVIVDQSNTLRKIYGLPTQMSDVKALAVLKTPTEQLHAAGIGNESVMGPAVYKRAGKVDPKDLCLFDQCFVNAERAAEFRTRIAQVASKALKLPHAMIYPPLLLRASKTSILLFHVNDEGVVQRPVAPLRKANLAVLLFAEGPIVPVMDADHTRFQTLIQNIYALQGVTDERTLESTLLTH